MILLMSKAIFKIFEDSKFSYVEIENIRFNYILLKLKSFSFDWFQYFLNPTSKFWVMIPFTSEKRTSTFPNFLLELLTCRERGSNYSRLNLWPYLVIVDLCLYNFQIFFLLDGSKTVVVRSLLRLRKTFMGLHLHLRFEHTFWDFNIFNDLQISVRKFKTWFS